jgi:hypothetical protein
VLVVGSVVWVGVLGRMVPGGVPVPVVCGVAAVPVVWASASPLAMPAHSTSDAVKPQMARMIGCLQDAGVATVTTPA